MMMSFATELVRFYDQSVTNHDGATAAAMKSLRIETEALGHAMLGAIEPDWQVESAYGRLRDAATLYSRTAANNADQRRDRFAAFTAALGGFAEALDGAEVDPTQIDGRAGFSRDPVPNPLADLG